MLKGAVFEEDEDGVGDVEAGDLDCGVEESGLNFRVEVHEVFFT